MTLVVRDAGEQVDVRSSTSVNRTRAAVMYRVGGRQYPMKSAPLCRVCQHHRRQEIESLVLQGVGYAAIVRRLDLGNEVTSESGTVVVQAINSRNIGDHLHRGHMPVNESITRVIMEDRAKELGKAIDSEEEVLADHITFARVGVARVFSQMQEGKIEPTMAEAIRLARLLVQVDLRAAEEGADQDAFLQGFMAYARAIQKNCSPEQVRNIGRDISADPVMKSLLGRSTRPIEAQTQEGVA